MTRLDAGPRAIDQRPAPLPSGMPRPMRVVHVDVVNPIPDVEPGLARDGSPYEAAWILARRNGLVVGHVLINFEDGPVRGERILADLREALGEDLGASVPRPTSPPDSALPFATIVVPT